LIIAKLICVTSRITPAHSLRKFSSPSYPCPSASICVYPFPTIDLHHVLWKITAMQIHLAKPGGQREGPFTIEQLNAGLAQRRFQGTDYWAWYEGLESWVPLHEIPGINDAPQPAPAPAGKSKSELAPAESDTEVIAKAASAAEAKKAGAAGPAKSELGSGLPIAALEQVFIFTDGQGPETMQSPYTTALLEQVIGVKLDSIRDQVTKSVFGKCDIAQRLRDDSKVPSSAWRAISAINDDLVKQTQTGAYKVCVRTFDTDSGQKVAAFLFYNKSKIK
jgi:hypothetical protein